MSEEAKPRVLLVDLSGLFWRAWMSNGERLNARDNTLALIRRCMEGVGFMAPVALCLDRGRSFRKDLAPSYKAQRPEKDLQAIDELRRTEQALADEGFTMWGADGFEADDVIATAVIEARVRGHEVLVASADKDLLQLLVHDGVEVYRTHIGKTWGEKDVLEKYGVNPRDLGDWLALVGDASDNIRGCPGVGEKTATKLLAAYGSLGGVIEAAREGKITGATQRALVQCEDDIRRGRKLVELRTDAPIDFEEIYRPRERKRPANQQQELSMSTPNEINQVNEIGAPAPEPAAGPPPISAPEPYADPKPAEAPKKETKAIVVPPSQIEVVGPFERGLEPANATQALNLANVLWRSSLYSKKYPNAEAIYAVLTRGRELGLGVGASLDVFHFFEGQLALHAHFIRHLAATDPDCEWFLPWPKDGDDPRKVARWATKHRRVDRPIVHEYTIEMAVDAGLCEIDIKPRDWNAKDGKDHRGNWDKRRPEMLDKTCSSQLARKVYPGRALGLYSLAELGGDEA